MRWKRCILGLALCSVPLAVPRLYDLEEHLLTKGILNTKDLPPFVGDEHGSVSDYLLNIWHWDGAIFLLSMGSIPCFVLGSWLLLSGLLQSQRKAVASP